MTRVKLSSVTFDLDGTLLDTAKDLAVACQRTLKTMGKPLRDEAEIRIFVGRGMQALIERCLTWDTPVSEGELEDGMRLFRLYYAEENGRSATLYPGVWEGLSAFSSAGLPLAVVTNKRLAYTLPRLEKTGLSKFFQVVVGGDSTPSLKPEPEPILYACRQLGVKPEENLHIGDSGNDVMAARAAGCPAWLVPYGYTEGISLTKDHADLLVPDLWEAWQNANSIFSLPATS
jgi:phosphoglycolate phosphatase